MLKQSDNISLETIQASFTLIEYLLTKYEKSCDLNDFFYFGCIFLGILASKFDEREQMGFQKNLESILNQAAKDGILICRGIMSANLETEENRNQAMSELVASLKGTGTLDSSELPLIADELNSIAINEDGVWKSNSSMNYEESLEKTIQAHLQILVDRTFNAMKKLGDQKEPTAESRPELMFLVEAAVNIGLMSGYLSILYKKPLEEYITLGANKINSVMGSKIECTH